MRPDPRMEIITRALRAANLDDSVEAVARRVHTALYGRPTANSPVEQAEEAKRRRDLGDEIDALMAGEQALQSAPWHPARPGDLVHVAYTEIPGVFEAYGETYLVESAEDGSEDLSLRLIADTVPAELGDTGAFATDGDGDEDPIFALWFEAGPAALTIVRDGVVVHGGAR